ncbi:hypothetical protein D3C83_276510 [compost metagenome]
MKPVSSPPYQPANVWLSTVICAAIVASLTAPVPSVFVITWKYTSITPAVGLPGVF